jgi:hypothetical protein
MVTVVDMVEVDGPDRALSFVVVGEPPVQKPHKMGWRHLFGVLRKTNHHPIPFVEDPTAMKKAALRSAVRAAMEEFGITNFPYFDGHEPLTMVVKFSYERPALFQPALFQPFPSTKSMANRVNLVSDACHGVLYARDDRAVTLLVGEKCFAPVGSGASTTVRIRKRNANDVEYW